MPSGQAKPVADSSWLVMLAAEGGPRRPIDARVKRGEKHRGWLMIRMVSRLEACDEPISQTKANGSAL